MSRNKITRLTVFSVLLTLMLFAVSSLTVMAQPSEPHAANAIWTEPSTITIDINTANIGDKHNVTLWVNVTADAFTWQARLTFNQTYFNVIRVGYTAGATSDFFSGQATIPVTPTINNIMGYVEHGESLLGMSSATGVGSLMWLELNLTQLPPENHLAVNYSVPLSSGTFIHDTNLNDIVMDTYDWTDIPVIPEFVHIVAILTVIAVTITSIPIKKKLTV